MFTQRLTRCLTCGVLLNRSAYLTRGLSRRSSGAGASSRDRSSRWGFVSYLRSLKWVPIPLGVGFAYIGYQQYGHVIKREQHKLNNEPDDLAANDFIVALYRILPLKMMSRVWGRLNSIELPVSLREPMLKVYIWAFNCNLEEAAVRDLTHYCNLGEFFRRRLRPGVRVIDKVHAVTSPSDGVVLHFGPADKGMVEQVKGINYSLHGFLGPPDFTHKNTGDLSAPEYEAALKQNPQNKLYHAIIYLAPGDYHGFHSPTDWTITHRRHFPGELFSVNPGVARIVQGLFSLNERAVYYGNWEQGFFSMAAVGATNVGSIRIFHDQQLETNVPYRFPKGAYFDACFVDEEVPGISLKNGEAFGEFNLGSTVVLVFEAPPSFQFKILPGQKILQGQPLGCYKNIDPATTPAVGA